MPDTPQRIDDPEKRKGMLEMPDGTFVEPLNGVKNPQKAIWRGRYSPIIGKTTRFWLGYGTIEWYVHVDGSQTTTLVGDGILDGKPSRVAITVIERAKSGDPQGPAHAEMPGPRAPGGQGAKVQPDPGGKTKSK